MSAKIMIGADFVPTKDNYQYFKEGNAESLVGTDILKKLNNSDFTIFNLEVPLTDNADPIEKSGPNLMAPVDTINGLKAINPYFFTLANNHILDQGKQGLDSTISILEKAGIAYAGAGKDLEEARKPYTTDINGIKVGVYCCTEREFTIAAEDTAGANPFDALESLDHVFELKKQCDYVVVLYHGGKEHYRYPSPYLQKVCRRLVEKGADLVVCQHSHCIGAQEEWRKGKIVYGQGNFLFDHSESEYWQTGLLIELSLEKNNNEIETDIIYHPLVKCKNTVRLAEREKAQQILAEFEERSKNILDLELVQTEYCKFAEKMLEGYLIAFSGSLHRKFLFRAINKLSDYRFARWLLKHKYGNQERIALRNFIECEAHRELILQGLRGGKR